MQQEIPNCEFTGDPDAKSEIRLWFKCPKCKRRIWNHLYNEHVRNCSRSKLLRQKVQEDKTSTIREPVKKERLVQSGFRSTSSRHRKRPPVNR